MKRNVLKEGGVVLWELTHRHLTQTGVEEGCPGGWGDVSTELKFQEWEGIREGRGDERANRTEGRPGRRAGVEVARPGAGRVAGAALKLETWVRCPRRGWGGGSAEGEGKPEMGVAGGSCPDHGSPGNRARGVDLLAFRRE